MGMGLLVFLLIKIGLSNPRADDIFGVEQYDLGDTGRYEYDDLGNLSVFLDVSGFGVEDLATKPSCLFFNNKALCYNGGIYDASQVNLNENFFNFDRYNVDRAIAPFFPSGFNGVGSVDPSDLLGIGEYSLFNSNFVIPNQFLSGPIDIGFYDGFGSGFEGRIPENSSTTPVPVPGTGLLFGVGLAGLGSFRSRKKLGKN